MRVWMLAMVALGWAGAAAAQDAPMRTRVALGPQLKPAFPGSDTLNLRPFVDVSRARADEPFVFEAADESAGFALWQRGGLAVGFAVGFEGKRARNDLDVALPKVGFSVEPGGFVQYQFTAPLRVRLEVRQGVTGHKGLVGVLGADLVQRDGDRWLIAAGPRLTFADGRYNRAYFGVTQDAAASSGLAPFRPGGGVQAVGANLGALRQLGERWGVMGYAKYDRLVDDPGRSPITRGPGARNQASAGVALSYIFGG